MHELRDAAAGDPTGQQTREDSGECPEADDDDLFDRQRPEEAPPRGAGRGEGGVLVATTTRGGRQAENGGEGREHRRCGRVGQEQDAGQAGTLPAELVGRLAAGGRRDHGDAGGEQVATYLLRVATHPHLQGRGADVVGGGAQGVVEVDDDTV